MLTHSAIRLVRRLLGATPRSAGPYAGSVTVLDGNTAIAVTEVGISEAAGLGASFPADAAELVWRAEQGRHGTNLAGERLSSLATEGPRGALSAAMGLAMSGVRASVFLSGPDLAASRDLLQTAAAQRLPLVIHVTTCTLAQQGLGSGHEATHLAADSGCILLVAANVQEAVDFTLIARHTAERMLTPVLVAMDSEQTALSVQDVCLAPSELVERLIGSADDRIQAPTSAQRLVFGDRRRRVPRRHDPDRPALLGALQRPRTFARGRAAAEVFFDAEIASCVNDAFADFARHTGRCYNPISSHRVQGAELLLVVQGSAIETAELAADHLRSDHRCKVGVIGMRCLRPFPGAQIVRQLSKGARVCVLERISTALAGDPPLLRELRTAIDQSLQKGRFGAWEDPDLPALDESGRPRLLSVVYGLGGQPLRTADLIALCRESNVMQRRQVYLGLNFAPPPSLYPKRQVLLDRLRRAHPELATLGLLATVRQPDRRPEGCVTLALHRIQGSHGEGLAAEAAAQLHRLLGGGLRTRPGLATAAWGDPCMDLVHLGPEGLKDPGEEPPVDLTLAPVDLSLPRRELTQGLVSNGAILVQTSLSNEGLWDWIGQNARSAVKDKGCALYRIAPPEAADADNEHLLGALCAVLIDIGRLDSTPRRLLAAREELLETADDTPQRLERFRIALAAIQHIDPDSLPTESPRGAAAADDQAPALVRRLGQSDDAYDSLPRFWDQVGVLFRNGDTEELTPDPYAALGTLPPLSASFRDLSPQRSTLPIFDPTLCTGCGACWSNCPDGAISAALLTPAKLLDAGIAATGTDVLRPIASKLAQGITRQCSNDAPCPVDAGGLLATAYGGIKDKLPFPDERKAAIADGIEAVTAAIGPLSLAATAPFFQELQGEGLNGELLALALEPNICKGCGICAHICEPGALTLRVQDTRALERARLTRRAFDLLPENHETSVLRARNHPDVDVIAAALLSRRTTASFGGGDGCEPGSGARLAMRMVLGITESHQAPVREAYLEKARSATEAITSLIRGLLADALPADDLDALSRALEASASGETGLNRLVDAVEAQAQNPLDTQRLRRLVEMAQRLEDLIWRLAEGRQGIGQAAMGLVLTDGDSAAFPNNPFALPVTLDPSGEGAQLAAGLMEGQLRQAVSDLTLLRKTDLEIAHPEDAIRIGAQFNVLSWRDLDEEERRRCPALWLVGNAGTLGGRGLAQVYSLLSSDLPVKILLLADLDLGLTAPVQTQTRPSPTPDTTADLALLALSRRGAYIAQSALAFGEHLHKSVEQALSYPGPALLHVHAPSPARHGFDTARTLERSCTATMARVFPLFRYDPRREGVFGSRVDLDDNHSPLQPWPGDGERGPWTLAHWALGETRFAGYFSPLDADDSVQIPFAEFLAMCPPERKDKIPFVEKADNGSARRLHVDDRLLRAAEKRQQAWRMLQELAGLVTPFTERVRHEAEAQVAAAHSAEIAALTADYEARLQALRGELKEDARHELRERLMQLAGYGDRTN